MQIPHLHGYYSIRTLSKSCIIEGDIYSQLNWHTIGLYMEIPILIR